MIKNNCFSADPDTDRDLLTDDEEIRVVFRTNAYRDEINNTFLYNQSGTWIATAEEWNTPEPVLNAYSYSQTGYPE